MSLLEACASGLRIVATDILPHRSIATLFPKQVSLFPVEDRAAFVRVLNSLSVAGRIGALSPPAESLEATSARRMSYQYQDLYDRTLSHSRAAVAH